MMTTEATIAIVVGIIAGFIITAVTITMSAVYRIQDTLEEMQATIDRLLRRL
jgi:uncharacterized membrane-anchored protein YhcB (DUF1043 family)